MIQYGVEEDLPEDSHPVNARLVGENRIGVFRRYVPFQEPISVSQQRTLEDLTHTLQKVNLT